MNIDYINIEPDWITKDWTMNTTIKSSYDINKYCEVIDNKQSLLTQGEAGCGKGFIIKSLSERYNCLKLTNTNVSARNIDGMTLHFALGYSDTDKKINRKNLEQIKAKNYNCMILDEDEILKGDELKILNDAKNYLNLPCLLFGDFKQLNSLDNRNYENSMLVKMLADFNMTEELLYHRECRMDGALREILRPLRHKGDIDKVYDNIIEYYKKYWIK